MPEIFNSLVMLSGHRILPQSYNSVQRLRFTRFLQQIKAKRGVCTKRLNLSHLTKRSAVGSRIGETSAVPPVIIICALGFCALEVVLE